MTLLAFVLCWVGVANAAEPERFKVDLSRTDGPNEMLLSVIDSSEGQRKVVWSRKATWLGSQVQSLLGHINTLIKKQVSHDGNFVILRWTYVFGVNNGWMFVPREGEIVKISVNAMEKTLGASITPSSGAFGPGPAGLLELKDEDPPAYHVWFPTPNKWITVDLRDPKAVVADAATSAKLNARAKTLAMARVDDHQPSGLGRLLKPLREKAAETIPGFTKGARPSVMHDDELLGSYAFLTVQKVPEGEKYIRGLLTFSMPPISPGWYFIEEEAVTMALRNPERAVGDALWTWWENATNGEPGLVLNAPNHWYPENDRPKHLAGVRGELKLPIPFPPNDEAQFWLYLLPDSVPAGEWLDHPDTITISGAGLGRLPNQAPIEQVRFNFSSLTPGRYRLKAVWDRRPPHAKQNERAFASPGDYESEETKPFDLKAGQVLRDFFIECTHRVAGADEYYAADEVWSRVAASRIDEEQREKLLAHLAPALKVIHEPPLLTNLSQGLPPLRMVRAALVGAPHSKRPALELTYLLKNPFGRHLSLDIELTDEHGCTFRESASRDQSTPNLVSYQGRFTVLPISSNVQAIARNQYAESLDIPPVTNVLDLSSEASAIRLITPETLPLRKIAGPLIVELSEIHRMRAVEFALLNADGSPASNWVHESTAITDRFGQTADHFIKFCRQEELFQVRATFAPDRLATAPHRWHIPVAEWPVDGESATINASTNLDGVSFQILAVGGKGTFSYRNGRVLESSPEIIGWENSAWPSVHDTSDFVRIRPANHFDPVHRDEVIVRLPHVALRIGGLRPEHRFRLIEEWDSPWRSLASQSERMPDDEPWFLPLNREVRKETGGMTLELARAITVDFAVRLPPETPGRAQK